MNSSKVVIIILNWNGLLNSRECLNSLKKSTYSNFEVIFIDNGSERNEAKILAKEFSSSLKIKFIRNKENLGFAQGCNQGINEAFKDPNVEFICLLNNDTKVVANFLNEAISKFRQSENQQKNFKTGMVAIRIMNYTQPKKIDSLGIQLTQGGLAFNRRNKREKIFCPCGAAAIYSKEMLEKIKENGFYFDPDYFCYAEDLDLGFRGRLVNFNCLLAEKAVVYHKISKTTFEKSNLAVFYTYRNIIWTLIKNLPTALWLKYLPKIIFGQLLIILLYFLRRKPVLILKAYFSIFSKIWRMLVKRKKIQKNRQISVADLEKYFTKGIFIKEYLKNLKI